MKKKINILEILAKASVIIEAGKQIVKIVGSVLKALKKKKTE